MDDTYKVVWLCKAKKAQKSFLFTDFVDDKIMGRIVFMPLQMIRSTG
jgi:hypothetical protein